MILAAGKFLACYSELLCLCFLGASLESDLWKEGFNLSVFSSHRGPLFLLVPLVQKLMEGPGKSCPGPGTFSVLDNILKGSCFIVQNKKKGVLHLGFTCNLLERRRMKGFRLPYFRRVHATRLKMRNTLFQTLLQSV